ncbi:MAG TPA: glutathione S-transferase N-terminal domain-containing protein [Polyangia bacterium]|nr:glutathione S-transferase N-terminal domain-containing protein [Polyangia bacterium]
MKLYGSLTSPFVRKIRILVAEKALDCELVRENPRAFDSHPQKLSPLGKVPLLALDDGTIIYDSPVIAEYLDGLRAPHLLPAVSPARWNVLRLQALGDGLIESTIKVWQEERRPGPERRIDLLDWESRRIERVLTALAVEPRAGRYFHDTLTLADIAVGVALEYLELRCPQPWRARLPSLAAWLEPIAQRPSFTQTTLGTTP